MTKTQAIAKMKEIASLLENALDALDEFRDEVDYTLESIEPYEGKDELTEAQEERQEWFESLSEQLDECADSIDDARTSVEYLAY